MNDCEKMKKTTQAITDFNAPSGSRDLLGGQNFNFTKKNDFLHFCEPKFHNNVFEKETAKCTQFRFVS